MSIDQATLKVNFEADLAKANQAVQILGDIKNALNALGNVKGVADLKSVVADLDKKFGDVAKKLGSINIDNVKTTKSVKAIEDERKALQELNAELTVYLSKTNQMIDKNRSIRGAANAIYGASPILDRRDEPISKANVLSMTKAATQIVAEKMGISLEKAAKAVETSGLDKDVRLKIGKAPNAAINILQSHAVKSITATAEAERAQLQAIKDRQEQVRRGLAAANAQRITSGLWKDYFNTTFGDFNQRYRPGMSREQRMSSLASRGQMYSNLFGTYGDTFYEMRERQRYENTLRRAYGQQQRVNYANLKGFSTEAFYSDKKKEVASALFTSLKSEYGISGADPFSAQLQNFKEFENRLKEFLRNLVSQASKIPENVRKDAMASLGRLGSTNINKLFDIKSAGFDTDKYLGPQGLNLTGVQTGIRFSKTDDKGNSIRMMWQGSEAAFLKYHATLQANKVEPEKFAPPKTTIAAWLNLKDSAAQVGQSIYGVLKDIEQPFTSIAISFSRIAYGLRTIQMGLIQFGATFTAVIGGATYAAQNFASSILEVTEIQKKAQITLEGVFGDKGLAKDITTFARQYAIETPATFREVTNMVKSFGFIPEIKKQILDVRGDAKALDKTLKDMAYTTIALGLTKPEQGIEGAVFSIREALAGQFRSLKMRFEMPMSAVAATVGMTEGQLKEDPKRIMEALKNFMDINVGEDTIKKLYRTFSTQLQNITDVFEKAKVAIGQSGFEEAMEQMAFNVASALEGMLNTNKFQQQLQGVSGLMTEFGRKMFGYGKALGWALVGGDKQMTANQIRPFTDQADKLAAKGQFGSKQDYMDFVETQLLVATATDKISVAYRALLKILDSVVPRITSLITELVGNQARIDQLTNNLITFLDMLFSVADGMLKLIMGAVTFINNLPIGNVGKTLALFAMAFPVATFQTGFAAVNMLIKSIIMLGKITATNNLANVGASLVKLSTDLGVFLTNMTTGRAASNAMLASTGYQWAGWGSWFLGGQKQAGNKPTGSTNSEYLATLGMTNKTETAAMTAISVSTIMSYLTRGLLGTGLLLIVGELVEKISGINIGFGKLNSAIGELATSGITKLASAMRSLVDAIIPLVASLVVSYQDMKASFGFAETKSKTVAELQQNRDAFAELLNDVKSGKALDAVQPNYVNDLGITQIDAKLSDVGDEILRRKDRELRDLQQQGITTLDISSAERATKLAEEYRNAVFSAAKPTDQLTSSLESLGNMAEGQAKLIESLAGKADVKDVLSGRKRAELIGDSNFFSSTNIDQVLETVDKFRLKQEYLDLQKTKRQYDEFKAGPMNMVRQEYEAYVQEIMTNILEVQQGKSKPQKFETFDWNRQLSGANKKLLMEQRDPAFQLMIKDMEKKSDVVRQANDDIRQSQIRILELQDNGIQAKFKANALELESKREELNLTQAIAKATLDAAIAAETDAAKRQILVDKMKELVGLQSQQTNLLNQEAALRDRATAIKEVGPVLKKFGMDTSSMQNPAAFAQFADFINKSQALGEHIGKIEQQNLKKSEEARNTLKATIQAEYEQALGLLSAAYMNEASFIEKTMGALRDKITIEVADGFANLGDSILSAVNNFASQITAALNGMQITVNVSAVINAALNMIDQAVGQKASGVASGLKSFGSKFGQMLQGPGAKSVFGGLVGTLTGDLQKKAKQEAERTLPSPGAISGYKPGGGGGGGKKESLEERNRMLKEIADSQYVGDELRKTAFHGYNENDYKKKIEEINKMKTAGVLKEVEAQQYLAAIKTEYNRKEMEFVRKLESERAKELTQYLSVIKEAENNPLVSGAGLEGMKSKLMALDIAEGFKEIEFKAKNAAESIKVMNIEMLKQVGLTRDDALNLVKKSEEIEKQNLIMKTRRENATGFEKGVLNLPSTKETFDKAQEDFISQLSSGLSDALANALDPDSNESMRESLSKLWKQLRRTVIKAFTDSLVNNLIRGMFGGGTEGLLGGGKTDAVAMATQTLTNAQGQATSSSWALNSAFNNLTGASYQLAAAMQASAGASAGGGGGIFSGLFGGFDSAFGQGAGAIASEANQIAFNTLPIPIKFSPARSMANGGIVSAPTLAVVGDNRYSPEVVAPLHKLKDAMGKESKSEAPQSINIVNVVDPQMVDKAIMNNPQTVVNVVAADMQNRGTTYQIMRGRR